MVPVRAKKLIAASIAAIGIVMSPLTCFPASASTTNTAPWAGFWIASNGEADGGFIGAYKLGTSPGFYRINPTARVAPVGYGASRTIDSISGHTAAQIQELAYLQSVYGAYTGSGNGYQAAGVDQDTYGILYGGKYSYAGAVGVQRTNETTYGPTVRSLAASMLKDTFLNYGRDVIQLTTTSPVKPGQPVVVTAKTINTRTQKAVAGIAVTIGFTGQSSKAGKTDSNGVLTETFTASATGWQIATASAIVPNWVLQMRSPINAGATNIVQAGVKAQISATARTAVTATPTLSVRANPTTVAGRSGNDGTYTLANGASGDPRTVTVTAYGPFPTSSAANCTSTSGTAAARATTSENGTFSIPSTTLSSPGYYALKVSVAGTPVNAAAAACSGATEALSASNTSIGSAASVYVRNSAGAVSVHAIRTDHGLASGYSATAFERLTGPFSSAAAASCSGAYRPVSQTLNANGTHATPSMTITKPGFYRWRSWINPQGFTAGSISACSAVFQVK